ncbi:hypothetical protein KAX35_00055, partial [candidate division WOR-3 bacterium]|nr:hypothetical protein [candidate division WOR-3 bacterium]
TGELKAYSRIKVSIEYSGTSDENVLDKSPGPTPNYDKLYKDFIINYDFVAPKGPPGEGAYLIITHDNFHDAVLPFAEWKHKKGIWTQVVKFSEINTGAPDSADIHNYIKWAYTNWLAPLEYVLLVGDIEFLACGRRPGSDWVPDNLYATDHCYSLIGGDDIFSDVYIGRLPANTTAECSTMVDKLVNYERTPYLDEISWYKSYTGLTAPGYFYNTTCKIADIVENYGYTDIEIIYDPPTPEEIMASINEGCGLFSFRGHGSPGGWGSIVREYINTSHISQLENGRKLTIVIAPTCLANAFNLPYGIYCMGETFVNQAQGAAGYYGATDVTWGGTNDSLAVGVFKGICEQHIYNFQPACDYGKWYMWQYYSGWSAKETIFRMNILGDPSLDIWTDVPKSLTVCYPPYAPLGASNFWVKVESDNLPVEDGTVCLWKTDEVTDEVYEVGNTVVGEYNGPINPITEGEMDVTITKHNYLSYEAVTGVGKILSTKATASACNNQRKSAYQNGNHLVLESNNQIFYMYSPDDGVTWNPVDIKDLLGTGKFPALAIDNSDGINVCWIKEVATACSLFFTRNDGTGWTDPVLLLERDSHKGAPSKEVRFSPPGMVVDNNNIAHIVVEVEEITYYEDWIEYHWELDYLYYPVDKSASPEWETLSLCDTVLDNPLPPPSSSSIDVDMNNNPHVVWDRDGINYKTKADGEWIEEIVAEGSKPFIDVTDNCVHIVWEYENDIYHTYKEMGGGWEVHENISQSTRHSESPQILDGVVCVWSEYVYQIPNGTPHDDYEVFYKVREGTEWEERHNLSNTSQDSKYPQIALNSHEGILSLAWTEGNNPPYEVKFKQTNFLPPLPPQGLSGVWEYIGRDWADITLNWNPNSESDLAGYYVYRSDSSSGPFSYVGTAEPLENPEYVDRVYAWKPYWYFVTAFDTVGNESGPSDTIKVEPEYYPGPCPFLFT